MKSTTWGPALALAGAAAALAPEGACAQANDDRPSPTVTVLGTRDDGAPPSPWGAACR